MPDTIERPIHSQAVPHATEYPRDRERRRQREGDGESHGERKQQGSGERFDAEPAEKPAPESDAPEEAAFVIDHLEEDHRLDSVSAYVSLGVAALHHVPAPPPLSPSASPSAAADAAPEAGQETGQDVGGDVAEPPRRSDDEPAASDESGEASMPSGLVRHAYEDHPAQEPPHRLNIAT
ncbi:hypothetical protein [Roseibium aestuarii]|uniref:Uncharacterized protein n=1 Tax=Roseibium aestuarii TaxID=2600299 RepID=A0ABW4JXT5_9HYPH|nr:hypothetical protein [Roseibium aestuarii]